jgi:hypothetical protein
MLSSLAWSAKGLCGLEFVGGKRIITLSRSLGCPGKDRSSADGHVSANARAAVERLAEPPTVRLAELGFTKRRMLQFSLN